MTYSNFQPEDLKYSGPNIWPRITAERVSDLFIFKRPELAYLEALRKKERFESGIEPSAHVVVTVQYKKYDDDEKRLSASAWATQRIQHHVKQDRVEDVRSLLVELRNVLERLMPEDPNPKVGVYLVFSCKDKWALATFQSRWI